MRRILLVASLLTLVLMLVLTACFPQVKPSTERDGDQVTISIEVASDIFDATIHVLRASTEDERCFEMSQTGIGCILGDLAAGSTTTIVVTSLSSEAGVTCVVFGYTDLARTLSYRPFPCETGG